MEKDITVFSPGLQSTPGWVSLPRDTQDWLLQKTSNVLKYGALEGMSAIGGTIELADIDARLKGAPMSMNAYLRNLYHKKSLPTAKRRLRDFKKFPDGWRAVLQRLAESGEILLRGQSGVGVKDLLNVALAKDTELPPKSNNPKVIDAFIVKEVGTKLFKQRSGRSKGERVLKLSEEAAAKILTNEGIKIMRNIKLETSAQKRKFLQLVCGWLMEAEGVSGTLRCGRIAIPEGVVVRRGRPRKKAKSE